MTNHKEYSKRATETATFRFTQDEKKLLAYLAKNEGLTQTGLIRKLVNMYALSNGITDIPEPETQKRPGRPKKIKPQQSPPLSQTETDKIYVPSSSFNIPEPAQNTPDRNTRETFKDLIISFLEHTGDRSEKVQSEINNTIDFVTKRQNGTALLPDNTALDDINNGTLDTIREQIKDAPIRFPLKNLHLTYLKMLFNYAVKNRKLSPDITPAGNLRSFTAKEIADAFPLPVKTL